MDATVERVDRTVIEIPYTDVAGRNTRRQLPHWKYHDVMELADGTVGYGEDVLYYGWGTVSEDDVERALGATAAELLRDDSLGSLGIALFDAVAKSLGVPVYELVGQKVHDEVPYA